ncbi:hypothetical protein [Paracoccus spongiarum]|uniref:Uncharacterized protein n=1 Tax=Paracoccus spongiarum TaxID=3064387 RepID=A0ABT9JAT4_9RHOB|nr:hypothetical protein [Paracoccus sp. 2205BS29-5]MDP5306735.1 hypothetical protein [Paracoccus sp. 2205BS29-5]
MACLPGTTHCASLSLATLFTMHLLRAIPDAGRYLECSVAGADCCPWLQGLLVTRPCRIADGRAVVGDAPCRGRDLARLAGAVPLSGPATRHERA